MVISSLKLNISPLFTAAYYSVGTCKDNSKELASVRDRPSEAEVVLNRGHASAITFQLSNAQRAHAFASGITAPLAGGGGWNMVCIFPAKTHKVSNGQRSKPYPANLKSNSICLTSLRWGSQRKLKCHSLPGANGEASGPVTKRCRVTRLTFQTVWKAPCMPTAPAVSGPACRAWLWLG